MDQQGIRSNLPSDIVISSFSSSSILLDSPPPQLSTMRAVLHHAQGISKRNISSWGAGRAPTLLSPLGVPRPRTRSLATEASIIVPSLEASDLTYAKQPSHVRNVFERLRHGGILKINLQFQDNNSEYLEQLIRSLNSYHGHLLPIAHSAKRGWFWDVQPSSSNFQAGDHQARSETMNQFPWHTDCSYEDPTPRYFALQVLQHDRYGGGTLSVMNVERLTELLTPKTRAALARPEFRITTPPEFIKDPNRQNILGSILVTEGGVGPTTMRYREDILTPINESASGALNELRQALRSAEVQSHSTLHLTSEDLPAQSIILVDNRRWLHARNNIRDPGRHLRRVRWDAIPFQNLHK